MQTATGARPIHPLPYVICDTGRAGAASPVSNIPRTGELTERSGTVFLIPALEAQRPAALRRRSKGCSRAPGLKRHRLVGRALRDLDLLASPGSVPPWPRTAAPGGMGSEDVDASSGTPRPRKRQLDDSLLNRTVPPAQVGWPRWRGSRSLMPKEDRFFELFRTAIRGTGGCWRGSAPAAAARCAGDGGASPGNRRARARGRRDHAGGLAGACCCTFITPFSTRGHPAT